MSDVGPDDGGGWSVINAALGTAMLTVAGLGFVDPAFGEVVFGDLVGASGIPLITWPVAAGIVFAVGFVYLAFLTPPRVRYHVDDWERELYRGDGGT